MRGLVAHRRGLLIAATAGVAVAVGLLASIGAFVAESRSTMSKRAVASVSVDWQVEVQSGADPKALLDAVDRFPHVATAAAVGFADSPGFQAVTGDSTQTTGAGVVVGLPDGYRQLFPAEVRLLAGNAAGVLLAQQTAANLHVHPGDTVQLRRPGLTPVEVVVDGVADLPHADSLFQKVGAPSGAQPSAPPDNVVVLPAARWHEYFDGVAAVRPDAMRFQAHVRLDHRLPSDPSAAFAVVSDQARGLELALAGSGLVGDNLAATLDAARSDALYAQALFFVLGLPGAVLASLLTQAVVAAGAERRRREQALLRARGATLGQLGVLVAAEAAVVGVVGAVVGLLVALVVGRLAFAAGAFGYGPAAAASLAGLAVATLSVGAPAWRDARALTVAASRRSMTVAAGRRSMTATPAFAFGPGRPASQPLWLRLHLDVVLLAAAAAVFVVSRRSGYQLVLVPEGVPSISVDYRVLVGPLLLWVGAGLFAWRLAEVGLRRGRALLRHALRPVSGRLAGTVASSMARRRRPLAHATVLLALTVSFAASTSVFNSTYHRQADADARLTNGADVTITEPPAAAVGPAGAIPLAAVPGVRAVEPLQHRFAYVGADLQDLYGVRPSSIGAAGDLHDSYFAGGSARQLLSRLAAAPDSILVSEETVRDFALQLGDMVTLRLQDARTRQLAPVTFRYAGVVREFPTAPRDSFLVANADYVAQATGSEAVGAFLVRTGGAPPPAVADRVRALVGAAATVTDVATDRRVVASSLTAVDLAGLTRVELGFALVLAAASGGLVLALGLAERRRTFAIAGALGATRRQLGGFVWAEAGFVLVGGMVAGGLGGWALSSLVVSVLGGVFDPPPSGLAVPWGYLGATVAVAVVALAVASQSAIRAARRPAVAVLREP